MKYKYVSIFLFSLFLVACSEYGKIMKSSDPELKFTKAVEYYEDEDCYRALPLLEELISLVRGTQRAEEVYYYYAQTHYCIGDYYLANYYFKNFVKTYPNSKYSEECLFLAAMCSYANSPKFSLDQQDTRTAINEFQLFLDRFPQSSLRDSCNNMIYRLREKIERKDVEIAKLYFKTERFKSAVIALEDAIQEYPDSQHREEMMFLKVKSYYLLAENSFENKKLERFTETTKSYYNFVAAYPESQFLNEAERYFKNSLREIDRIKGNLVEE